MSFHFFQFWHCSLETSIQKVENFYMQCVSFSQSFYVSTKTACTCTVLDSKF